MKTPTSLSITVPAVMTIALAAAAAPASSRPFDGPFVGPNPAAQPVPGWDTTWAAPAAVSRVGAQIVRCDTGEGNLGGAGAPAPVTLPEVSTCLPAQWAATSATAAVPVVSAVRARQLEHDLLR